MIQWLRDMLVTTIALLAVTVAMPFVAVGLCRTPEGAEACFWLAPLSAGVLTLVYSQLSSAPWRQGGEAVRQWRAAQSGMPATVGRATAWLFGSIVLSYAAEVGFVLAVRKASWLPVASYSPLAFAWLWRRKHA